MDVTSLADQKLQLEIEEMRRSPWRKPSSLALWVPVLLGIFSLVADYKDVSGWRQEVKELELQHSNLIDQVSTAVLSLETTKRKIDAFVIVVDDYTKQYGAIKTTDGLDRYVTLKEQFDIILANFDKTSADLRKLVPDPPPTASDPGN